MTESARHAFINSLCYMKAFDGQSPGQVQANYETPEHYLASIYFLRASSSRYVDRQVARMQEMIEKQKVPQEVIDQIGNDPKAYFRNMMKPHTDKVLHRIPDSIRKQHQDDVEKLIQFYTEHAAQLGVNSDQQFVVETQPSE